MKIDCFPHKKMRKKKKRSLSEKDIRGLTEKMRLLQLEMNDMMCEREKESRAFERELMVSAFKEAEWKEERKMLKGEVKSLRKTVEEKEEIIRDMGSSVGEKSEEWEVLGAGFLVEQMREERARRDEAVDKWKQLYLAIKIELDDLIQKTHGDVLCWRTEEEEIVEELRREVKEKEETIEVLKTKVALMEIEQHRTKREVDILRQSLRIVSSNKNTKHLHVASLPKNLSRFKL